MCGGSCDCCECCRDSYTHEFFLTCSPPEAPDEFEELVRLCKGTRFTDARDAAGMVALHAAARRIAAQWAEANPADAASATDGDDLLLHFLATAVSPKAAADFKLLPKVVEGRVAV